MPLQVSWRLSPCVRTLKSEAAVRWPALVVRHGVRDPGVDAVLPGRGVPVALRSGRTPLPNPGAAACCDQLQYFMVARWTGPQHVAVLARGGWRADHRAVRSQNLRSHTTSLLDLREAVVVLDA